MNAARSVLAVLAGLVSAAVTVVALTWLAVAVMLGGDFEAEPTPGYLAVNLTYTFGAGVLGGWVAAKIAGARPLLHAGGLALVMLTLSLGGGSGGAEGAVPTWYGPAVGVLGALGALSGGLLRSTGTRPPEGGSG